MLMRSFSRNGIEFECFCTYLPPYVVVKHNPARRRRRRRRRLL
jgi:hypothetical protein